MKCAVTNIQELTGNIYALSFVFEGAAPRPGQFLHIKCGERVLRRPISVCDYFSGGPNAPPEITIVVERRGDGTEWLVQRREGDMIDALGPLGRGYSIPENGDILLVSGGVGAAPLLYAAASYPLRAEAVLGFRTREHVILTGDYDRLCKKIVVATDDGGYGYHGTVAAPMEDALKNGNYAAVLSCGPPVMLRAVAEIAARYGVPCQVSMEERMACGVGACLVCACMINTEIDNERAEGGQKAGWPAAEDGQRAGWPARVCRDGPVFDAREVVW